MNLKNVYVSSLIATILILLSACSSASGSTAKGAPTNLILATTTSTQDSGLLDVLIPAFEKENNINVKTIAVGTGQALEMGKKGEADVLLVHAPEAEQELIDSNDAINRKRVMYNDFIMAGPKEDPAKISGLEMAKALKKINERKSLFVSRGDDSGTHKKELELWKNVELQPFGADFYLETGQGMVNTLRVAAEKRGYVLTDRATYLAQQNQLTDLMIMVEGDGELLNVYHVMQVNPETHPKVNEEAAKLFVEFMTSEKTQEMIQQCGVEEFGEQLFFLFSE
ncbi:substrate-binding domain-containing protein [Bacillus canaveralius]|uniref:substrate-binding domain-containing protein n=1 Tax=Bacillus canaveralius TaxID=1403243 RepID=UPI000F781458|nr:substrate-binding domain-containing protein [Bacillus canaveralius]RSK55503.1 tungsten ABC transporter substrate-binding protein [Bacillus canaveralius]